MNDTFPEQRAAAPSLKTGGGPQDVLLGGKGRLSPVGLRAPPVLKDGLKAPPNGLAAPKQAKGRRPG